MIHVGIDLQRKHKRGSDRRMDAALATSLAEPLWLASHPPSSRSKAHAPGGTIAAAMTAGSVAACATRQVK